MPPDSTQHHASGQGTESVCAEYSQENPEIPIRGHGEVRLGEGTGRKRDASGRSRWKRTPPRAGAMATEGTGRPTRLN